MKIKGLFILCFVLALLLTSCGLMRNPLSTKDTPKLFPISQNDKVGYINRKGEIVIQPQFAYAGYFSEGLAVACVESEKCGYIDDTGKFIINPQFKIAMRFSEGLAGVIVEDKLGFVDKAGKYVINPQFNIPDTFPVAFFSEGLANVKIGDKYGFVGKDGKIVINPQFDYAAPFFEGLAAFRTGGKWGYIDKEGKIVINPQYDFAFLFSKGLAAVKIGEQSGYIDKTGKIAINPQFNLALPFSDEGIALVSLKDKIGFIDKEGKYVVNPQFSSQGWSWESYFLITSDIGIVSFSDGLAPISVSEGKAGYIDKTGKFVMNPQFNLACPFYGGLALVFTDSGRAYIDKEGKYVWREVKESPSPSPSTNTNANVSNDANSNTESNTSPQTSESTQYEGTINNNYVITMNLTRKGDSLSGYVTPKSSGISLPVRGAINSEGDFNLGEYDDQNNLTGTYKGRISGGTIEGKWTKPDGSAERPLFLREK